MIIKCLAVEDEPMAMKKLCGFIQKLTFLQLEASFDNSLDALNYLNSHEVDLLFLDIQMDQLTGIQLLESLPCPPKVILTTAYSHYALKGYELHVSDYLLKPYSFERLAQAVNKVKQELQHTKTPRSHKTHPIIFVKTAYEIERVVLGEIRYIQGMKDYLGLITGSKRIMCLQSFKVIQKLLPASDFVRVHKSYIVALNHIESISHHRIKIEDQLIPISETYREAFYKALEEYRGVL